MSLAGDLRILYHMVVGRTRGANHAERLDNFYRGQAAGYDDFRKRLLHGRKEMIQALDRNGHTYRSDGSIDHRPVSKRAFRIVAAGTARGACAKMP